MLIDDKHQKLLGMPRDELVFMIQALRRIITMEQEEHRAGRVAFQEFKLALKTVNVEAYCEVEDYLLAEELVRIEDYLHDVEPDKVAALMENLSNRDGKVPAAVSKRRKDILESKQDGPDGPQGGR